MPKIEVISPMILNINYHWKTQVTPVRAVMHSLKLTSPSLRIEIRVMSSIADIRNVTMRPQGSNVDLVQ